MKATTELVTRYRLYTIDEKGALSQPKHWYDDLIYNDTETEQELHDKVKKQEEYFEYTILSIYKRNFVF